MRVKQVFLSSLLILALPTTGTILGDSSTEVDVQGSHDVGVSFGVSLNDFETASRASFLSPSYILQGIQTLRVTSAIKALVEPKQSLSDSEFWEIAKKSEKNLESYVHRLLEAAASYFKSVKFTDITSSMNNIVSATATFRDNIKDALDAHHITLDTLTEELEGIFMGIVHDLEKIPSPNKARGCAETAELVDKVLDDITQALLKLARRYEIEEKVVTSYLLALRPHVQALIVTVCEINEQCPQLLPALIFSITVLLIPESWILRPLLSLFGFGPAGPIKGSTAAWMQRYFWGAAVEAGSWFAWLQAAGMGVLPKWAALVIKIPFLVGGLLQCLLPYLNRG